MDAEPFDGAIGSSGAPVDPQQPKSVTVGGFRTAVVTRQQLADRMLADCREARKRGSEWRPKLVFSSNGQGIALAGRDKNFAEIMQEADIIHADGMSVVFASRLTSAPLPERVATTDFFEVAAQMAVLHGLSFFILGATKEQNAAVVESIARLYPGLRLAGYHHGYFGPDEDEAVCQMVRESGADVLWVGLGKPLQEQWCVRNRDRLRGVGWIKTCGGLYSFLTGSAKRAPQPMQDLGLEWFHRMLGDPRRLVWRYLTTNPLALYQLLRRTEWTHRIPKLLIRILLGTGAPALFAAASFLLSIVLHQFETPAAFGTFAFIQVLIGALVAVSSSLFGGPVLIALVKRERDEDSILSSFFRASLAYCSVAALVVAVVSLAIGATASEAVAVALLGAATWFRMFLRSTGLALQKKRDALLSDITYAIVAAIGLPFLVLAAEVSLLTVVLLQMVAVVVSLFPLARLLARMLAGAQRYSPTILRDSFAKHGRWALLGGLANRFATNAYIYVITLGFGPSVFAPIAFATLLFRPLGVALTGLVELERPLFARSIAAGSRLNLVSGVNFVTATVALVWAANALLVVAFLVLAPERMLREGYGLEVLAPALVLVGVIVLTRSMREPASTAMQAWGAYRELALLNLVGGLISISLLFALMFWGAQPSLLLAAALGGEVSGLVLVRARYHRLKSSLPEV